MRPIQTMTLTLILGGTLAGCAGVGKQDFACPGYPSKPLCLSASEVYRLTEGYPTPQPVNGQSHSKSAPRQGDDVLMEIF